jgi:ABC-type multidrug transport system fused ATPase/permease subunit
MCGEEGLARPKSSSGFIFAALILGGLGFLIIAASRYDIWSKRRGRKFIESHFAERFNAFMSSGDARDKASKATEMVKTSESFRDSVLEGTESGNSGSGRGSMIPQSEMRVDLTFRDLTVTLANGLKILNGVSGEMKAGTMTAIMGPSGCGKSTLMNALTNRIRDGGKVGGKIYINGEKKHLTTIAHVVGFVPQEDVMHRDLTVRENLRFYLRLKGDPTLTRHQRRR